MFWRRSFISFAIFSTGAHFGFSTRLNVFFLKACSLIILRVKLMNQNAVVSQNKSFECTKNAGVDVNCKRTYLWTDGHADGWTNGSQTDMLHYVKAGMRKQVTVHNLQIRDPDTRIFHIISHKYMCLSAGTEVLLSTS